MLQGLLPLHLNCPWRVAAASAVVRSSMLGPTAAIGAVRLAAPIRAACTFLASMPTCSPTVEPTGALCVALRIDPFASLGSGTKTQQK